MTADVRRQHTIDAAGLVLGRIATRAATILRGKHKPTFAPHIDAGDFVRIVNTRAIRFTGQKPTGKLYRRATGYPGGLKTTTLRTRWERDPVGVVRDAVFGMLPRNRLRASMIKRLTVEK